MSDIRIHRLEDDCAVYAESAIGQDFIDATFDPTALAWRRGHIILSNSNAADLATLALAASLSVRVE